MRELKASLGMLVAVVALAGCPSPAALDYEFEDAHLAPLTQEQMEPIYAARRDIDRAEMEVQQARAELRRAERDVERAENLVEQAELALEFAETNFEEARESLDPDRIEAARGPLLEAQQDLREAEARLAYAEALRDSREAWVDYREGVALAARARGELTEARVVAAQGLEAPGPSVAEFEEQYEDRRMEARRQLAEAQEAQEVADAQRASWRRVAGAADEDADEDQD